MTGVILSLFFIIVIILASNIRFVPQAYAYVIERLGGYYATWGVGPHFKIPFLDRVAKRVNLKEQVVDFPPQPVSRSDRSRHWNPYGSLPRAAMSHQS